MLVHLTIVHASAAPVTEIVLAVTTVVTPVVVIPTTGTMEVTMETLHPVDNVRNGVGDDSHLVRILHTQAGVHIHMIIDVHRRL